MSNALVLVRSYKLEWFCFRLGLYLPFATRMCLAFWSIFVFASVLVCFNFKPLYRFRVEGTILSSARFLSENICLSYTRIVFCVHFFVRRACRIFGMFERTTSIEQLIRSRVRLMVRYPEHKTRCLTLSLLTIRSHENLTPHLRSWVFRSHFISSILSRVEFCLRTVPLL